MVPQASGHATRGLSVPLRTGLASTMPLEAGQASTMPLGHGNTLIRPLRARNYPHSTLRGVDSRSSRKVLFTENFKYTK